ncbi:MAG: spore germination protein [Bacillota bacterium]|nr:spore germination protein [Bacillota bacterium]
MFNTNDSYKIAEWIKEQLQNSFDIEFRDLQYNGMLIHFMYITSVCDIKIIQKNIILPFFEMKNLAEYRNYLISYPNSLESKEPPLVLNRILHGSVAVFLENNILMFDAKDFLESPIAESMIETVIQGPKDAFREKLDTNMNLIRQRYHRKTLKIESQVLGMGKIPAALLYDQSLADYKILEQLKNRLEKLKEEYDKSIPQLHKFLMREDSPVFPTILLTDRPDRVINAIYEGKIILVVEGFPFAMVLPSVFFDFISSMEDVYQVPVVGRFLTILRYFAIFITISLPGLYVGITSYNPELFRFQLAISISGNRVTVPYPSFVEIIMMLVMTELLNEASSRLPKVVGPAATTVGGLIIGQAAAEAGIISNIMVIIVSAVAISNFILPVLSMNFAIRLMKYPILILSIFFGLNGVVVGIIALIFYLSGMRSFGKPYLQLFSKKVYKPISNK